MKSEQMLKDVLAARAALGEMVASPDTAMRTTGDFVAAGTIAYSILRLAEAFESFVEIVKEDK